MAPTSTSRPPRVRLGIEELIAAPPEEIRDRRLGLLCNQASTNHGFIHSRDLLLARFPGRLRCLFSPQHGFFSEKQDNMIESDHGVDPVSGLPVYSLYGETRRPLAAMFEEIDLLLVDLVDVGTRVYTFAWTVIHCLEVAAETGVRVVILDRPNPLGGRMEGNMLRPAWSSFVGLHEIPMRHGLTLGELALLCNRDMGIGADLSVVPVRGWRRAMLFPETGLPWVFPSPNMPTFATALVYPGQVLWEGTNISEGRGTTLPFELFGAPFIDHADLAGLLAKQDLAGCILRPLIFEPCFGKWSGEPCQGFQIHVTDSAAFRPYRTSLILLQALLALYPEEFQYKDPPYEYEFRRLPMDLILGDQEVRVALEEGVPVAELEASWQADLDGFRQRCRDILLYR